MKILIIIDSLGSGGAERSTEVLCDYLYEKDIPFQIIVLDKRNVGVQTRMLQKGYKISFLEKRGFLGEVRLLAQIIKKEKFSLVHSILFRSNLRTRCAKFITNFIHLESLVNTTYSKERKLDKKVNQTALKFFKFCDKVTARKGVDHFHSITETVKTHYINELGLNPEKITVIFRGRKPILSNFADRIELPNKEVNFINVGRHEFQKGQIFLLEAAKILKEEGYSFKIRIYGREGTVTPVLKDFVETRNLGEYVTFEGYSTNIPERLLESDIFIFPSLYEGLGGALIEAQAA
ncbi:glycosyltransferase [Antarcticibacterium sp. 1MA-6-2]|uniref:glycosyltransferase n=1 Tax=Antarcticibacterium sp. 1MA-6-2 TaxID=2908210 RepID=UPI001F1B1555|nr:glycosyltransferase [Antarcticibacterium sp. 1MA-6-2]UJH91316.1 glycosyltransferase [Antarcticibacterium sp. 1MA-6-2]